MSVIYSENVVSQRPDIEPRFSTKLGSDVVTVSCFGVRVSVIFHFMFVHYTFSSVWVAEWPPFGK